MLVIQSKENKDNQMDDVLAHCHDLAKQLSYYLYSFFFLFTTQEEVWESVMSQVSHSHSHLVMSYNKSHDGCGKVVHRLCSNCISSVQKIMETLLSSPCQLGLGG